ncbi:hypothetical protein BLNAU_8014 [Blattamonas nauphoetae]|uniref:Uncharacterized protein n=1 Tax=Blattamonas nauphoetae TaxID=2049346 RepID=A0ABQ9XZQ4_9EUKA|nr:hypothetical protein BLNAU_8014 [Blattamonas nauphoetae]
MSEIAATAKGSGALFLNVNPFTNWPLKEKAELYNSLVSLVKVQYPFDDVLQYKVVQFLEAIRQHCGFSRDLSILTKIVPDDNGIIISGLDTPARLQYLNTEFISTILNILQPHTLPIASHTDLHDGLINVLESSLLLAASTQIIQIINKAPDDRNNIYELIYYTVVVPSSQYLHFLLRNRYVVVTAGLSRSFHDLLSAILKSSPYHTPTLECFISHSIVTGVVSLIPFVEDDFPSTMKLTNGIMDSLWTKWEDRDLEVALSGQRMTEALRTEGLEDSIEQTQVECKKDIGLSITVIDRFIIFSAEGYPYNSFRFSTVRYDHYLSSILDFWTPQKDDPVFSPNLDAHHFHAIPQPFTLAEQGFSLFKMFFPVTSLTALTLDWSGSCPDGVQRGIPTPSWKFGHLNVCHQKAVLSTCGYLRMNVECEGSMETEHN